VLPSSVRCAVNMMQSSHEILCITDMTRQQATDDILAIRLDWLVGVEFNAPLDTI